MVIFKQFAPVNVVVSGVIMSLVLILVGLFLCTVAPSNVLMCKRKFEGLKLFPSLGQFRRDRKKNC